MNITLLAFRRVAGIAVGGAWAMAVAGAKLGAPLITACLFVVLPPATGYGVSRDNALMLGIFGGGGGLGLCGFVSGLVAFGIIGLYCLRVAQPKPVQQAAERAGARAAIIGGLLGALIGAVDAGVWFYYQSYTAASARAATMSGPMATYYYATSGPAPTAGMGGGTGWWSTLPMADIARWLCYGVMLGFMIGLFVGVIRSGRQAIRAIDQEALRRRHEAAAAS